jgi:hypothetical protein
LPIATIYDYIYKFENEFIYLSEYANSTLEDMNKSNTDEKNYSLKIRMIEHLVNTGAITLENKDNNGAMISIRIRELGQNKSTQSSIESVLEKDKTIEASIHQDNSQENPVEDTINKETDSAKVCVNKDELSPIETTYSSEPTKNEIQSKGIKEIMLSMIKLRNFLYSYNRKFGRQFMMSCSKYCHNTS